MLKQVSWAEYFSVLTILAMVYYTAIVVLYYRNEVWNFITRKKLQTAPLYNTNGNQEPLHPEEIDENQVPKQLIQDLQMVLGKKFMKEELIMALQQIFKHYEYIKETALQNKMNMYIKKESEIKCSIHLSEDDLRALWLR